MAMLFAAFVGLLAAVNNGANAQTYPSGSVKLFVPVPAGGVTDTITSGGRRQARLTRGNWCASPPMEASASYSAAPEINKCSMRP